MTIDMPRSQVAAAYAKRHALPELLHELLLDVLVNEPEDPVEFMAAYLSAKAAAARAAAGVSAALHEEAQSALEDELSMLEPRASTAGARVSSGSARFSSGGMVRPDSATPRAAAVSALVKGAVEAVLARPSNVGQFTVAPEAAEEEQLEEAAGEAPAEQEDEVLME